MVVALPDGDRLAGRGEQRQPVDALDGDRVNAFAPEPVEQGALERVGDHARRRFIEVKGHGRRLLTLGLRSARGNRGTPQRTSQPTKCRPSCLAALITTNEPAAGSTTRSPGSVTAAISRLIRPIGLMCGCAARLTFSGHRLGIAWSRHVRALTG